MLYVCYFLLIIFFFFFSSRRRHTRFDCDWSSDVCSSDLGSIISARILTSISIFSSPLIFTILAHSERRRYLAVETIWLRSEERRVGKECRSRWSPYH